MLFLPVLALAACLSGALAAALFTEARRRRPAPSGEVAAQLAVDAVQLLTERCWLCASSCRQEV